MAASVMSPKTPEALPSSWSRFQRERSKTAHVTGGHGRRDSNSLSASSTRDRMTWGDAKMDDSHDFLATRSCIAIVEHDLSMDGFGSKLRWWKNTTNWEPVYVILYDVTLKAHLVVRTNGDPIIVKSDETLTREPPYREISREQLVHSLTPAVKTIMTRSAIGESVWLYCRLTEDPKEKKAWHHVIISHMSLASDEKNNIWINVYWGKTHEGDTYEGNTVIQPLEFMFLLQNIIHIEDSAQDIFSGNFGKIMTNMRGEIRSLKKELRHEREANEKLKTKLAEVSLELKTRRRMQSGDDRAMEPSVSRYIFDDTTPELGLARISKLATQVNLTGLKAKNMEARRNFRTFSVSKPTTPSMSLAPLSFRDAYSGGSADEKEHAHFLMDRRETIDEYDSMNWEEQYNIAFDQLEKMGDQVKEISDAYNALLASYKQDMDGLDEEMENIYERLKEKFDEDLTEIQDEHEEVVEELEEHIVRLQRQLAITPPSHNYTSDFPTTRDIIAMMVDIRELVHGGCIEVLSKMTQFRIEKQFRLLWNVVMFVHDFYARKFYQFFHVFAPKFAPDIDESVFEDILGPYIQTHWEMFLDEENLLREYKRHFLDQLGVARVHDDAMIRYVSECGRLCWAVMLAEEPSLCLYPSSETDPDSFRSLSNRNLLFDENELILHPSSDSGNPLRVVQYVFPGLIASSGHSSGKRGRALMEEALPLPCVYARLMV